MLTFEAPLVRIRLGKRIGFAEQAPTLPPKKVSGTARSLALGHRIVRAVEFGEVRDFSDAARRMGVSQARVSMLVSLTFLAPDIQNWVILGASNSSKFGVHGLIRVSQKRVWRDQNALIKPPA